MTDEIVTTVMESNKITVMYALEPELVAREWVRTGKFLGLGATIELKLDKEWKRQLIFDLGWCDRDGQINPYPILDLDLQLDPYPARNAGWTYSDYLSEHKAWEEIKKLAKTYMKVAV